jgi:hypothetical protein
MVNLRSKRYQKSLNDDQECTCKYCSDCACYLPTLPSKEHLVSKSRVNTKINDDISIYSSSNPFRDFMNKELSIKSSSNLKSSVNLHASLNDTNINQYKNINNNNNNNNTIKKVLSNESKNNSQFKLLLKIPVFIKHVLIKLFKNLMFTLVSMLVLVIAFLKLDQNFFNFNNLDEFYNKLKKAKGSKTIF